MLQRGLDSMSFGLTDLLTDAGPITLRAAAVAAAPRPLLLIVAGTSAAEARSAEAIRAQSPGPVQV